MVIVEGMENKDVQKLKKEIEKVEHVKEVLWYDDALDITVPVEMLPEELRNALFTDDATMMIALFDKTTSDETTMEDIDYTVDQLKDIVAQLRSMSPLYEDFVRKQGK